MLPISLTLKGFKSFETGGTYRFPEGSGFYFMTGRNEVEPDLEANGSGKTTVWDAVCWALYGKTARGLKATNVVSWSKKAKCGVTFVFDHGGERYEVFRSQSPNKLELGVGGGARQSAEQSDIEAALGLGYDSFLYAVLFSQFRPAFLDLKPTAKAELFSSILDLDYWDGLSKRATSRASELEGWLHDYKDDLAKNSGMIEQLEAMDFDAPVQEWEAQREKYLEGFRQSIQESKKRLVELEKEEKEARKLVKSLEAAEKSALEVVAEVRDILKEFQEEKREAEKQQFKLLSAKELAENELRKFKSVDDVCPYCNQEVDEGHLEGEISRITAQIREYEGKITKIDAELGEIDEDLRQAVHETEEIQKELMQNRQDKAQNSAKLGVSGREMSQIRAELRRIQYKIEETEKAENPHLEAKKRAEQQLEELKASTKEAKNSMEGVEKELLAVKYWGKGFREVRLFLISEVLEQLELETNTSLFRLGLRGWEIRYDTDKETKSGTIKKGFEVMIKSPHNTEWVPWEAWSGGESQRLRLAGTLGLSNLILARSGITPEFEVFDEPSTWLSQKGIEDLLDTLDARAREEQKQIWIIDHRSLDYGRFDGMVTVVKDEAGSHFETDNIGGGSE